MYNPTINARAFVTLSAFLATWEAEGWVQEGPGQPGEYFIGGEPIIMQKVLSVAGTPDDGDAVRWDAVRAIAQWAATLTDADLAALIGQPESVPGLRSLDEIVAYLETHGVTRSRFFDLLDRFNPGARQRGDWYLDDGVHGLVAIPAAIWTQAMGNYVGSALKQFIDGTGGHEPLAITLPQLALARETILYTGKAQSVLTATGGVAPYTWSIVSGQLPLDVAGGGARMQLNASTGAITGTPAQTPSTDGVYDLTFRVTDVLGRTADAVLPLTVLDAGAPLNFSPPATLIPPAQASVAYSLDVSGYAGGGTTPRTFAVVAGTAPDGLTLSSAGVLAGTPTAAGAFSFTIRCTDAASAAVDAVVALVVTAAPTSLLANAREVAPLTAWGMERLTALQTDDVVLPNERFLVGITREPQSYGLATTLATKKQTIIDAETAYLGNGKAFDVDRVFHLWGDPIDTAGGTTIETAYTRWTAARGRIPWINVRALRTADNSIVPWSRIGDGYEDATIDAMATAIAGLGAKVIFCFHHEPESHVAGTVREAWNSTHTYAVGDVVTTGSAGAGTLRYFKCAVAVNPASATNPASDAAHWTEKAGTATEYKAAWARIRTRFTSAGVVDAIEYMFNAGAFAWNLATSDERHPSNLIPPNTVIDWAAVNPFNFIFTSPDGATSTWCPSFMDNVTPASITQDDAVALALRCNLIVDGVGGKLKNYLGAMRAANPNCKIVKYINGTHSLSDPDGTNFPSVMYGRDSLGNLIHPGAFSNSTLMDISHIGWQNWLVQQANANIALGYDGNFLDVMGTASLNAPGYESGAIVHRVGDGYGRDGLAWTTPEWIARTAALVGIVKAANTAKLVVPNGIGDGTRYPSTGGGDNTRALAVAGDLAMMEQFGRDPTDSIGTFSGGVWMGGSWRSEAELLADVDAVKDAAANGLKLVLKTKVWLGTNPSAAQSVALNAFYWSLFKLADDGNQMFAYSDAHTWAGLVPKRMLEYVELGAPSGAYAKVGSYVYRRDFAKGTVLVNPNGTAQTVTIGSTMYVVDPATGYSAASGVTSITVQPHTAQILLKSPTADQWASFSSLVDGGTNGFYQWVPANRSGVQLAIGAWGCVEDRLDPNRRAGWIADMADKIKTSYPLIRMAVLYDNPHVQGNPTGASDWRLSVLSNISLLAMKVWTIQNRAPGRSTIPTAGRSWYVSAAELLGGAANPARGYDTQGTGANQGDGSLAHPYATIGKAMTQASAGDVIVALRGVYRESIAYTKGVHLFSARGHFAWVDGRDKLPGVVAVAHPDLPGVTIYASPAYDASTINRKHTTGRKTTVAAGSNGLTINATPQAIAAASTAAASPWPDFNAGIRRAAVTRVVSGTRTIIGEFTYTDATLGTPGTFNGCVAVGAPFTLATGDQIGGGASPPFAFADEFATTNPMAGFADQVFIAGWPLRQVATRAEVTPGTWTFWIDVNATGTTTVYLSENPAGQLIEYSVRTAAWTGNAGGGPAGSAGTDVEQCGIGYIGYATTLNATKDECATMLLSPLLKRWSLRSCVWALNAANAFTQYDGFGHVLDNCLGVHNGALAGHVNSVAPVGAMLPLVVRRSRYSRNNWHLFDYGASSFASIAAWKLSASDLVAFVDTDVDDNPCTAIWFDVLCTRPMFINTRTRRNGSQGSYSEVSTQPTFLNIVATDNAFAGIKVVDGAGAAAGTEPYLWCFTTALNGGDSSGAGVGRAEMFLYDDPRTNMSGTPVLAERYNVGNGVMVAGQTTLETILKTMDGNNGPQLSVKPLIAQPTAVTFRIPSTGHSFTATCVSTGTALTIVSYGTLVPSDAGLPITCDVAGTLAGGTTLVYPGKSNYAARLFSTFRKVLFARLVGFTTKPIAKLMVQGGTAPGGQSVQGPSSTALDVVLGQTTGSVAWNAPSASLDDVFVNHAADDYRLVPALLTPSPLVAPDPIPQAVLDRVNAAFGLVLTSFTPDQIGYSETTAALLNPDR